MTPLDRVCPTPRKLELDAIVLAIPAVRAWHLVRHHDLAHSPLARALFAIRTLPSRLAGTPPEVDGLRLDGLVSTADHPGFQVLVDEPPREVVVGAIGKVWQLDIPFVHVSTAADFAAFDEPGFVKVAWALRVTALDDDRCRLEFELRVDATDEASWKAFQKYFRLIGPASHLIRRSLLGGLLREHGGHAHEVRPLPGDELLHDAAGEVTNDVTIAASAKAIWPWLVQMGGRRAGFYSVDWLDNGGTPSAFELHPELQKLRVGDVLPATPTGDQGFEVLRIEPARVLILGGLFDAATNEQIPFTSPRPASFWHVTWAFVLEPLGEGSTRLHVRARASFSKDERGHARWMGPVHHFMESVQLRHLAARAERREPKDHLRDVAAGFGGAAIMTAAYLTPFARGARNHWGIDEAIANRTYPGDPLIAQPRWAWTHGIEIDAPAEDVWPWVAQIGADRGGFYSYQWLENVAGCDVKNAEAIHPEWAIREGGSLRLHPKMPALPVVYVDPGRAFVAYAAPDTEARAAGRPWIATSWLFQVEPLGPKKCRFVSRYRCASSDDIATRLQYGEAVLEPIGFAMDRRMLLGVKERVEKHAAGQSRLAPVGVRVPSSKNHARVSTS